MLAIDDDDAPRDADLGRGQDQIVTIAGQAAREVHALALDVRARGLPQRERLGVIAKVDADLLQDGVGVVLDGDEALFIEHLVVRQRARDVGNRHRRTGCARGTLGLAPAAAVASRRWGLLVIHEARPPAAIYKYARATGAEMIRMRHGLATARHRR